jgi:predicted nucleic acid-binding protein
LSETPTTAATSRYERLPSRYQHPLRLTRQISNPQVERWLDEANDEELYFSVISLGEILKGITILPASKKRDGLQEWLDGTLRPWFEGRILSVTAPIAERWGALAGECRLQGRQIKVGDGLILATALHQNLTIVTRNVKDFSGLGVAVLNPWEL